MPCLRALPALRDNYIWMLVDAAAGAALVVDPGDAEPVLRALQAASVPLAAILLTHHHADHIGGVAELLRHFPQAPVFAPDDARIPHATRRVGDGDTLQIEHPAIAFKVLGVPGHTRSHVAYYGGGLLFCGDTLFSLGCGRVFEGTAAQMLASLDSLAALPGETQVCAAHEYTLANAAFALTMEPGNPILRQRANAARILRAQGQPTLPAKLAEERAANPFLRVEAIDAARLPQLDGVPVPSRVQRFAALRQAKDRFAA